MKKIIPFMLTALTAISLASCGSKGGPTYNVGDTIFENRIVYDTSKEAYAVSVKLNSDKKVSAVACGRAKKKSLLHLQMIQKKELTHLFVQKLLLPLLNSKQSMIT